MLKEVIMFKFDKEGFKTFYMIKAKSTRKNFLFHERCAKLIMESSFNRGFEPKYILDKYCTRSGCNEVYRQEKKIIQGSNVFNISGSS